MKAPRRSFLVSVAVTFLLVYAVSDIAYFVFNNLLYYHDYQVETQKGMADLTGLGLLLMRHDEDRMLVKRLEEARKDKKIGFFVLKKNGKILDDWITPESFGRVIHTRRGLIVEDRKKGITYITSGVGPYFLAIGVDQSHWKFVFGLLREEGFTKILGDLFVTLMACAIVLFFFRDLRELIEALRSPEKARYRRLKPVFSEASVVLESLKTYESRVNRLEKKEGVLSRHVASAVRTELQSGRTPPYQFRCTMVRTDINQYSTIFSSHPVEPFMAVINEFFTRSSGVILRYQGYITDFVGDEIIFYFKDEEHPDSAATALAAIREIQKIAEELHQRTSREFSYPFTVKSALSCGSLRFGPQVNGFALSGGVFVETVRILSHVEEKLENSVYFPSRIADRLSPVCESREKKSVELKGVPGVTRLHKLSSFAPAREWLEALSAETAPRLVLFREPEVVAEVLERMRGLSTPVVEPLLKALSGFTEAYGNKEVRFGMVALLGEWARRAHASSSPELFRLLSFGISVSRRILKGEAYDPELREVFRRCLSLPDRRVVANAVDAFIHFDPANRDEVLLRLLKNPDNRIVANALIKIGMVDLGKPVIQGLHSLLRSESPLYQASGLFALGELTRIHLSENPVFLKTHFEFRALFDGLEDLKRHSDPMVRRQAELAWEKSTALRETPESSGSESAVA